MLTLIRKPHRFTPSFLSFRSCSLFLRNGSATVASLLDHVDTRNPQEPSDMSARANTLKEEGNR